MAVSVYGFNGKEKDSEWNSGGAMYDYGFRIYDPRIAKFLSVDPLTKSYPWYTPYQFAGNMPIQCIDLDGLEPWDPNQSSTPASDHLNSGSTGYKPGVEEGNKKRYAEETQKELQTPKLIPTPNISEEMKDYNRAKYESTQPIPYVSPIPFVGNMVEAGRDYSWGRYGSSLFKAGMGYLEAFTLSETSIILNEGRAILAVGDLQFGILYRSDIAIGGSLRYVGERSFALEWHTLKDYGHKSWPKLHMHYSEVGKWSMDHHIDIGLLRSNLKAEGIGFKELYFGFPDKKYKRTPLYRALEKSKIKQQ